MNYAIVRRAESAHDSEGPLLGLLDTFVEERGRMLAADEPEVKYRTLALCCDSRQVYRRMRRALPEFRDQGGDASGGAEGSEGEPVDGNGDNQQDDNRAALRQRVAELEDEDSQSRGLADVQAHQLEELNRTLAALEDASQEGEDDGAGPFHSRVRWG